MRIEIWSDVVCPWCYIGKRRLENALESFPHRDDVEIVWRSFQLDPSAPTQSTETVAQYLGRKYGGGEQAGRQMVARTESVAAAEGLHFRHGEAVSANTFDAHRLLHLAHEEGRQGELKEALLSAYFTQAQNVGDHDVLRKVSVEAGLDPAAVDAALDSDAFAADVRADIDQARAYGANGVPFFVVDAKYGVSGAQPTEVFSQVLDRAWSDSHPQLAMVAEGDACGPDGCEVPSN